MKSNFAFDLLKKVKNDYSLIADDFSRTRENIWGEIRFLFSDYIKKGDNVLDLGCGNGRYYNIIKEKGAEYLGVDNSVELIKIAQQKYPEADFMAMDALKTIFPDFHFDKVVSIAVLHHIPSNQFRLDFMREARRILKTNGLLILTVWKFKAKKEKRLRLKYNILRLIGKSKMDFNDILEPWADKTERYYHCFSKRELARLTQKAGFKIIKLGLISNDKGNRNNYYLVAQKK